MMKLNIYITIGLITGLIGFEAGYEYNKAELRAAKQKSDKELIRTTRVNRLLAIEDRLDKLEGKTNIQYQVNFSDSYVLTNWGISNIIHYQNKK